MSQDGMSIPEETWLSFFKLIGGGLGVEEGKSQIHRPEPRVRCCFFLLLHT